MTRDNKQSPQEPLWISREDLQDIAKIGGDLLKRTVSSSIDVLKDVTDTLPKDAGQLISKSREEMMKGLSREFAQNLVSLAVDKVFSAVRDHSLDISIRVRKAGEAEDTQSKPNHDNNHADASHRGHSTQRRRHHESDAHDNTRHSNHSSADHHGHQPAARKNPRGRHQT